MVVLILRFLNHFYAFLSMFIVKKKKKFEKKVSQVY